MNRILRFLKTTPRDMLRWWHATADGRSWLRVISDMLRLKLGGRATNEERSIRLQNGRVIFYRLNKGDMWSMREVLLDECYRFPGEIHPEVVVDLGGNIGLTSLWFDTRHAPRKVVVVEPSEQNARIARKNLLQARAEVVLVEAAAGSRDGTAHFSAAEESNHGTMLFGKEGLMRVVCMASLFREANIGARIDLLKVDIEGGEAELFSRDLEWMDNVQNIIAELHPDVIDADAVRRAICSRGFRHIPPGSVFKHNMEAFVRERP